MVARSESASPDRQDPSACSLARRYSPWGSRGDADANIIPARIASAFDELGRIATVDRFTQGGHAQTPSIAVRAERLFKPPWRSRGPEDLLASGTSRRSGARRLPR